MILKYYLLIIFFGPKHIQRWYKTFLETDTLLDNVPNLRESRWPPEVVLDVEIYVKARPILYIEELQENHGSETCLMNACTRSCSQFQVQN